MILAALISLCLILVAPSAAGFFDDARLEGVLYALSLGVFVSGFENIGIVAFRKELTFHKEFYYLLAKKMSSFMVTVGLAFYLRNYWALVIGYVSTDFLLWHSATSYITIDLHFH